MNMHIWIRSICHPGCTGHILPLEAIYYLPLWHNHSLIRLLYLQELSGQCFQVTRQNTSRFLETPQQWSASSTTDLSLSWWKTTSLWRGGLGSDYTLGGGWIPMKVHRVPLVLLKNGYSVCIWAAVFKQDRYSCPNRLNLILLLTQMMCCWWVQCLNSLM